MKRFAERHGFGPAAAEVTIYDDAPAQIRGGILMIAEGELGLSPSTIRGALCTVVRKLPDPSNWSEYPNVWGESQGLMDEAPWYRVYDFVEAMHKTLAESRKPDKADRWTDLINEYFLESGVGWRLVNGRLESRTTETFQSAVDTARAALNSAGLETSRQEIHEAVRDLSRRPIPDLTGAVSHAMAALECTAREATGDAKATLGAILKKHPGILPKPLDDGLEKMWGFASEFGRHLREGQSPSRQEVELVVSVAAASCTYLSSVIAKGR